MNESNHQNESKSKAGVVRITRDAVYYKLFNVNESNHQNESKPKAGVVWITRDAVYTQKRLQY